MDDQMLIKEIYKEENLWFDNIVHLYITEAIDVLHLNPKHQMSVRQIFSYVLLHVVHKGLIGEIIFTKKMKNSFDRYMQAQPESSDWHTVRFE
jgi:hypothetical protein